ncbi:hypothetical protein CR513_28639, partial [Mucuna pruriens]
MEMAYMPLRSTIHDTQSIVEFCSQLGIKHSFTSIKHPQTNGQVESANKMVLKGLRKILEEVKWRWTEELLQVLWSYHTSHLATQETYIRGGCSDPGGDRGIMHSNSFLPAFPKQGGNKGKPRFATGGSSSSSRKG